MRKKILILLLLALTVQAKSQDDGIGQSERQYTSWAVEAGPNLYGFRFNLANVDNAPDRIAPALGAEAGAAISYHIVPQWQLRLTALACLERVTLTSDGESAQLTSEGADIALQAGYSIALASARLHLLAGPYTHFIVASQSSNHTFSNPFSRTGASNPRTGNTMFAMGEFNAGAAATLMLQFRTNWQLAIDLKWGITSLLNDETHKMYIRPYKLALHAGHSF